MRLALINPPTGTHYAQPPLGLLSLAAVALKAGHDVQIIDGNVENVQYCLESAPKPDIVGISVVSCAEESARKVFTLVRELLPKAPIIIGGPHATALPKLTLEALDCQLVVVGEGETTLLKSLNPDWIETAWKRQWTVSEPTKPQDLDALPIPAYHLLDWSKYHPHAPHGRKRFMPVVSTRGCPYACTFCSRAVFGKSYRAQSPERTMQELWYLRKAGIGEVAFYDDSFTLSKKRLKELCYRMQAERLGMLWSCETRVDLVDLEMLQLMRLSGCASISYGIESANQETLNRLGKHTNLEQSLVAVRHAKKAGLEVAGYFMLCPDFEDDGDMRNTVEFAKELDVDYAQFSILTPLPGSDLWKGDLVEQAGYSGLTGSNHNKLVSEATREFYLRQSYILKRVGKALRSWGYTRMLVRGAWMFAKEAW